MKFTQEISIFNPKAIEYAVTALGTRITQTAAEIRLEAEQTLENYSTTIDMRSEIRQSALDITSTVSETYATIGSVNSSVSSLSSRITQNANSISSEVTNRKDGDNALSTRITQNANSISSEITNRKNGDTTLSSRIEQTLKSISFNITNNNTNTAATFSMSVTNEGGSTTQLTSKNINLTGLVTFSALSTSGQTTINGSNITTGTINANRIAAIPVSKVSGSITNNNNWAIDFTNGTFTIGNISANNITSGTLTGRTISGGSIIQTVSGARTDGLPGNKSNGEQASIQNGVIKAGELAVKGSVTTVSFVPEGGDGRGSYGIYCTGHFSTEGAIWTNGEIGEADIICRGNAFAQNFIQSSDRRLKENIVDLEEDKSCKFIYGLKPVSFDLKADPGNTKHGFIAQDVEELVTGGWDVVTESDVVLIDGQKTKALNYTEIIADLVAAVQSQNKRIAELEGSIS